MLRRALPALLFLLFLAVPAVEAHANYFSSEPARGARLSAVPSVVNVTLSEQVDPGGSTLEVRDGNNALVSVGRTRVMNGPTPVLSVDLREGLGPGAYLATWRALSSVDGHVTSGSWGFAVGGYDPPSAPSAPVDYAPGSALSRSVAYAGYALGIGAIGYALFVDPALRRDPRGRILGRSLGGAGILILLGITGVSVQTWDKTGLSFSAFSSTDVGKEFVLRAALAWLTFLVSLRGWRGAPNTRLLSGLGVLFFLDALGSSWFVHSANKGAIAVAADLVHLITVSLWLGGLAFFLWHIKESGRQGTYEDVIRVGRRFSTLALTCVTLLGLSGLASTALILGTHPFREPWSLWSHPYGAFLASKILLFGAMLAVAGINRFIFLGHVPGPDSQPSGRVRFFSTLFPRGAIGAQSFGRAVSFEATLGLVVLVLAGFLTAISPPSAETLEEAPYDLVGYGDYYNVTLRFLPLPSGGGTANVTLRIETAATGEPLETAIRVRVYFLRDDANESGGEAHSARPLGGGSWLVGDVFFAQPGGYIARVDVQTEEVFRDTIEIPFEVAQAASTP